MSVQNPSFSLQIVFFMMEKKKTKQSNKTEKAPLSRSEAKFSAQNWLLDWCQSRHHLLLDILKPATSCPLSFHSRGQVPQPGKAGCCAVCGSCAAAQAHLHLPLSKEREGGRMLPEQRITLLQLQQHRRGFPSAASCSTQLQAWTRHREEEAALHHPTLSGRRVGDGRRCLTSSVGEVFVSLIKVYHKTFVCVETIWTWSGVTEVCGRSPSDCSSCSTRPALPHLTVSPREELMGGITCCELRLEPRPVAPGWTQTGRGSAQAASVYRELPTGWELGLRIIQGSRPRTQSLGLLAPPSGRR